VMYQPKVPMYTEPCLPQGRMLCNLVLHARLPVLMYYTHYAHANLMFAIRPGIYPPYQFINVPSFMGRGESTPSAYFYQNLGEAEYCVACYQVTLGESKSACTFQVTPASPFLFVSLFQYGCSLHSISVASRLQIAVCGVFGFIFL